MPSPKRPGPLDFSLRENLLVLSVLLVLLAAGLLVPFLASLARRTPVRTSAPRPGQTRYLTGLSARADRFFLLPEEPGAEPVRSALALVRDGYLERAAFLLRGQLDASPSKPVRVAVLVNLANVLDDLGDAVQAGAYYREAIEVEPKNPYLRYNHAVFLHRSGDDRQAMAELAQALKVKPDFDRALLMLGNLRFAAGELKAAVAAYDRIRRTSPLRRQADYNTAMALQQVDPKANAKTIERLLAGLLPGRDTVAYFAAVSLAHLRAGQGDLAAAREHLLAAVSFNTQFFTAWYNLGLLEKEAGRPDLAVLYLQKAMERRKDSSRDIRLRLADLYYGQGRTAPAIALLERLVTETNDLSVVVQLADLYYENGASTWSDALDLYAEVIRSGDADRRLVALANSGNIWFGRNDFARAVQFYDAALRLAPTDVRLHHNRGLALARMGRPQEAMETFLKVLALKPDDADAAGNVVLLNARLNRMDRALELAQEYLLRHGDDPKFLLVLAGLHLRARHYPKARETLDRIRAENAALQATVAACQAYIALKEDRPQEAVSWYDRALELRPDTPSYLLGKSIALGRLGLLDEALRLLNACIGLTEDPKILSRAYLHRGNLLYRQGDYAAAFRAYERVLDYDSASFEAHHNLGLVRQNLR